MEIIVEAVTEQDNYIEEDVLNLVDYGCGCDALGCVCDDFDVNM